MVEILKALSRGAKLLVMDEPTSSLTVREEDTLFATVDQLKASGIGIVYISHRMADVLRLSDRISIVKDGRLIGPLMPSETSIAHIASLMSRAPGSRAKSTTLERIPIQRRAAAKAGAPALSVSELRTARKLSDIAFDIQPGKIVGLAGLVGSGRSTLAKAIFGLTQSQLQDERCKPAVSWPRSRLKSALSRRTGDWRASSPAGRWQRILR